MPIKELGKTKNFFLKSSTINSNSGDGSLIKNTINRNSNYMQLLKGNLKCFINSPNKAKNYYLILRKQLNNNEICGYFDQLQNQQKHHQKCFIECYKDVSMKKFKFFIDLNVVQQIDFNRTDNSIYLFTSKTQFVLLKANDSYDANIWLNKICESCGFYEKTTDIFEHHRGNDVDDENIEDLIGNNVDEDTSHYSTSGNCCMGLSSRAVDDNVSNDSNQENQKTDGSTKKSSEFGLKHIAANVAESVGSFTLTNFFNENFNTTQTHEKVVEQEEEETKEREQQVVLDHTIVVSTSTASHEQAIVDEHDYEDYLNLDEFISGATNGGSSENIENGQKNSINTFKNFSSSIEYIYGSIRNSLGKNNQLHSSNGSINKVNFRSKKQLDAIATPTLAKKQTNSAQNHPYTRTIAQRSLSYAYSTPAKKFDKPSAYSSNDNIKSTTLKSCFSQQSPSLTQSNLFIEYLDNTSVFSDSNGNFAQAPTAPPPPLPPINPPLRSHRSLDSYVSRRDSDETNSVYYAPLDVVVMNGLPSDVQALTTNQQQHRVKYDYICEKLNKNLLFPYIDENSTRYTELDSFKTKALHNTMCQNIRA